MSKQKKILLSVFSVMMLVCVLIACTVLTHTNKTEAATKGNHSLTLISEEATSVDIVTAEGSDYALIFSSDTNQSDQTLANELAKIVNAGTGLNLRATPDTSTAETEFEILIGDTNREESAELLAMLNEYGSSDTVYVWGFAYINGKLLYTANCSLAFSLGKDDFLSLVKEDGTVSAASDLLYIGSKTAAEYEEELKKEEEIKMQDYIEELKEMNDSFSELDASAYKPMIAEDGSGYFTTTKSGEPWLYPTEGQHPRYLITESNVDRLKEILAKGQSENSEYYNLAKNFWELADAGADEHYYGIFPEKTGASGQTYRYSSLILTMIDAKALAYLITGDEMYALEAIVCIKNAMLSLKYTTDLHSDVYHGPSHVMVVLAAVYDWCYDYLTEEDKWQMITGCALILGPQMEEGMQYPPSGMSAVSGHGTGPQLTRDWLTVSIVFYDEAPDWYRYVAGRFFNEYIPVHDLQYEGGWVNQGTANYAQGKIKYASWAYYMLKLATGENFMTEDASQAMYYLLSYTTSRVTENGYERYLFQTGDGAKNTTGKSIEYVAFFYMAALFEDPELLAYGKLLSNGYRLSSRDTMATLHPSFMACFISAVDYNGEVAGEDLETIQYFGYPAASMTARAQWNDENSPVVLMRMLNLTAANHEGREHGTFHIYYKGLLTGTSGAYDGTNGYGSTSHRYYSQSTVAANGLLIYNPGKAGNDSSNASTYYYSGDQRYLSEAGTIEKWTDGSYVMSETTGAAWGYYDDGSSKYAYLSGDLTKAYDSDTVDYVSRSMFTLFTGDEDFPMLFFTFDKIESDSESYTKHWLLHAVEEPTVDTESMTATFTSGEGGKMYVVSLFGADAMVKIGGEGKAWWINGDVSGDITSTTIGKNVPAGNTADKSDIFWGRIELRATGEKYSKLLTVMAVTDEENEAPFEIEKFVNEDESVFGAKYERSIIAFTNNTKNHDYYPYSEISFTTAGKGLYEYYIAGVEAGTWNILVDGISVAYANASSEGHILTFTAPTGTVEVKPTSNVIGANGGKIIYNEVGGAITGAALYGYNRDTGTPITAVPKRGNDVFLGWYTSPDYEPETFTDFVPAGTEGDYVVYAKWLSTFLDEDYTTTISHTGNKVVNGVSYNAKNKEGASFRTDEDENGTRYLEWIEGSADPIIYQESSVKNFSKLGSDEKCVTYTVKLRLNESRPAIQSTFRLNIQYDVNGSKISTVNIPLFKTDANGNVTTNGNKQLATLSADRVTTVRVVMDFINGELRYFDQNQELIYTESFSAPSSTGAKDTVELLKCLKNYLWYWYPATSSAISDASLLIYGIRVQDGDEYTGKEFVRTEGIKYNTLGAELPVSAPLDFNIGKATPLPTDLTLDGYVFGGWYTTPTYDEGTRTYAAPLGTTGIYEVYAKWNKAFIDEDYESGDINITEADAVHGGINYSAAGQTGASFVTKTASNGDKYLAWSVGEGTSTVTVNNSATNIGNISEKAVSYTLILARESKDAALPNVTFKVTANGESGFDIILGQISEDGKFTLGASDTVLTTIGHTPTALRIVLDFASGTVKAYDKWGVLLGSVAMPAIPENVGAQKYTELMPLFGENIFTATATGNESLKLYRIKIDEGNIFLPKDGSAPAAPDCTDHIDVDQDGNCDICEKIIVACDEHIDLDADGLCDECANKTPASDVVVDVDKDIWGDP